jgi:hypothetical protein
MGQREKYLVPMFAVLVCEKKYVGKGKEEHPYEFDFDLFGAITKHMTSINHDN